MKPLSKIAAGVSPSATLAVSALAKKMKAEGKDVIGFGAGEPDFATPDRISYAGVRAICDGKTRYTPAAGMIELRQAICDRVKADYGLEYEPTQAVVASGAKHTVYIALGALVDPGDEVIVPSPYWVSYCEMVRLFGGVPVVVDVSEEQGFQLAPEQLEAAITDKTKAIILNNPSNPTGAVYSKEALKAVADVCVKHDLYIISDEIYDKLIYDGAAFTSVPALGKEIKEHTILINGVSKTYAMTGWRIGYVAANDQVSKVIANYLSHCTGSPSSISQKAAVTALTASQESVEVMRKAFERRRDYMVERMNSIEGVSCIKPHGAFYVMMNIEKLIGQELHGVVIRDADDFGNLFLKYGKVAVVPGTGFGAPTFVRWSYATSIENIKEGLNRLERFLKGETI